MEILKLYKYIDGIADTPFPNQEEQVVVGSFQYEANRMGGAPSITATAYHRLCLDDLWEDNVYAEFRGEKYFVMNTPSSSKSNEDERYKHDIELLSEREALNHVYFIDAVQGDSNVDVYKSNSTKVQFMGDINEFVGRLNACLSYNKLGYTAVIDEGISSDVKNVTFEDKYILEALQEEFNVFEVPYYFVGKVIHFGYSQNVINTPLKYGSKEALLSVSKENANYQVINRITGTGGSDNIPFYYPNNSPKGELSLQLTNLNDGDVKIKDYEKFANKVTTYKPIYCRLTNSILDGEYYKYKPEGGSLFENYPGEFKQDLYDGTTIVIEFRNRFNVPEGDTTLTLEINLWANNAQNSQTDSNRRSLIGTVIYVEANDTENSESTEYDFIGDNKIKINNVTAGVWYVSVTVKIQLDWGETYKYITYDCDAYNELYWEYDGSPIELSELGLELSDGVALTGTEKILQNVGRYIAPSKNLMPPVYRESSGEEMFYNAENNTYESPDLPGEYYEFENEYSDSNRKEGKVTFEDIKPTITGIVNSQGERIDSFLAFAYDRDDNDDVDEEGNYLHPYFFAKLRKTDGEFGFNLFDHALEGETMQISMTSGVCGACSFEIGVGEETEKNTVQVDQYGNLLRDENGNVRCGRKGLQVETPQDIQQDTTKTEVWIALKKDDSTYPQIMPNKSYNYRPSVTDTFVILGISLPKEYILNAEEKLKQNLIKYMYNNNREKFTFSIKFSRIFFKEHPYVESLLNENARILVDYNGQQHILYVDNYTYKADSSSSLPEIEVSLADTLTIGQNSLQNRIDGVKQEILSSFGNGDFLKYGLKYFIRKDIDDYVNGDITFNKRVISNNIESKNYNTGAFGSGYSISQDGNGKSRIEVDEIYVRLKAYFDSLEIKNLSHVGGRLVGSPAGMKCTRVEILSDESTNEQFYRCYFKNEEGVATIYNQFAVNDLAQCRSFNLRISDNGSVSNRYYWRKVIAVGDDYIDLSMNDCEPGSMEPMAGDNIVTIGNTTDTNRQNIFFLSSYDDDAPCFKLYSGINSYSMLNKEVTVISPNTDTNIFTGKLVIKPGSTGYGNIGDAPNLDNIENQMNAISEESKNDIAKQLGYSSYAELESYANRGNTIIDGGIINTSLINSELIVTSALIANAIKTNRLDVNGKFIIEKDGTFKGKSGTLENMLLTGAYRSPFKSGEFSWDSDDDFVVSLPGIQDNNNVIIPNSSTDGFVLACKLPVGMEYDGFNATILNEDFGNEKTYGSISLAGHIDGFGSVPIFENGERLEDITIAKHEGVDIQGFSNGVAFIGWIVKNRFKTRNTAPDLYYTITVVPSPEEGGSVSGGGYAPFGAVGRLTAIPNEGYDFIRWENGVGDTFDNPSIEVTWLSNYTYTAVFSKKDINYLISVSSSPQEYGYVKINNGEPITGSSSYYQSGTILRLTAIPNDGYILRNWSDGDTKLEKNITCDSDKSIIAFFEKNTIQEGNLIELASGFDTTTNYFEKVYSDTNKINISSANKTIIISNIGETSILQINLGRLTSKIKANAKYELSFTYYKNSKLQNYTVKIISMGVGNANVNGDWSQILNTFEPIGHDTLSTFEVGLEEKEYKMQFTAYRASTKEDALYLIYGTNPFDGNLSAITFIKNLTLKEIE